MRRVLITGTAGFIGYHLAEALLAEGHLIFGYDGITDYYDVALKRRRHQRLLQSEGFVCDEGMLEDMERLQRFAEEAKPEVIVHLAAQAGVRYSLENPRSYVESNLLGTFNVIECARELEVEHLLMASTSSVYGANEKMPFQEVDKVAAPLTLYAATKLANEAMGHSYAHLWQLPTTMFRFFTVYGPWGRPDMALFKFVRAALDGEAIDVYNRGQLARDFTYVGDLATGIAKLIDAPPPGVEDRGEPIEGDSLSPAAPFRVVNIGNGVMVPLMEFIDTLEDALGIPIEKNFMEMQKGDVHATHADNGLLERLTGFRPETPISEGVPKFVAWYRDYFGQ
ncbi:MAG: NAD-dependent epimerase/dehydratase family protein [Pseudomonadota bacterium]